MYDDTLDLVSEGLLGECAVNDTPPVIRIDANLEGTTRFSFTLAHELGHLAIHRGLRIPDDYATVTPVEYDLVTGAKRLVTKRDWIEWQANRYAQALLLPQRPFKAMVMIAIQRHSGLFNQPTVHLNADPASLNWYITVRDWLAHYFGTSKSVIQNRMTDLKLLIDHRDTDRKHMSQLVHRVLPRRAGRSLDRRTSAPTDARSSALLLV